MARNQRNPFLSPWAGAFALGSVVVGLAALSGRAPTRPWTRPVAEHPAARLRVPLHPVTYHDQPITIRPNEILALAGRRAAQSTFRVLLSNVLQEGTLKVTSPSGLLVIDAARHRLIAQVPGNVTYAVSLAADGRALAGPGGNDLPAETVRIQSISPDTPMETGARSFLGTLEVRLGARGLDVINEVAQEDYIAGVVAGEAAPSFPLEALKAQAVAARTYALSQRGHRGDDVDVVDTVADQVYTGAGQAWPEVRAAVAATTGQIMTYGGRPIIAYFSADCGGMTRSNTAAGLGSRPLPYLKPVRDVDAGGRDFCAVSPSHTWSLRLTEQDILPKVNAKLGTDIRTLSTIRFSQVYSDGRVGEVTLVGAGAPPASAPSSGGAAETKARPKLPSLIHPVANVVERPAEPAPERIIPPAPPQGSEEKAAPAQMAPEKPIPDSPAPGKSDPEPTPPEKPESKPAPEEGAAPEPKAAPSAPAEAEKVEKEAKEAAPSPGGGEKEAAPEPGKASPEPEAAPSEGAAPPPAEGPDPEGVGPEIRRFLKAMDFRRIVGTTWLRSQIMSVEPDGTGAWVFYGRGYGHGVGLCQWGADGMARQGIPYERILKHYYTGIALEPNAPRNGTLQGIATDGRGHPLVAATVTLIGTDREVRTDAKGRYRFEALPAATYDIAVSPVIGAPAASFAWTVHPNEATTADLAA